MSDLDERFQNVRLLLLTLNDPYPTPRSALVSDSGPAASRYVPCETCRQRGEVRARGGWVLCLSCDGRGWRRREGREPAWDAYLKLPLVEAAALPRASSTRRLRDPEREEAYAWERALQTYDRHGSYGKVRRQLDWLSRAHPPRHRLVRVTLVDAQERVLSPLDEREVDLGVLMITLRVGSVRVPPWLIEKPMRKDTVDSLLAAGLKPGEIARRLGLSKQALRRKIRAEIRSKIRLDAGAPVAG